MAKKMTFRGGIHPLRSIHEGKPLTGGKPIAQMPPPKLLSIPMSQHVGAPAKPVVKAGDRVLMGQVIGEAQGFVSVPVHSSVSGVVKKITNIPNINGKPVQAVIIENDFLDEPEFMPAVNYDTMSPAEIIERIKQAGNVGMGGAAFPTHVKLSPPPDKKVDLLIVNGAECEPFLTADQRVMTEQPEKVIYGIRVVMRALNVRRAFIGIEDNKPEAIARMSGAVDAHGIRVVTMETKYPQGSEKQLIDAITGRQVPSGGLPMDTGVVVVNISSAAAIAEAFLFGEPLIRRVVTVTGAVKEPQNFMVRIGTPMQDVIDAAGGFSSEPLKIISGGPMMGLPVPTTECVIVKGSSGILVLDKKYTKKEKELNCIRCGKCVDACPIHLMPAAISQAATAESFDKAEGLFAMDCISCGSCSYVCPAKKPIAQNIKFAKEMIMVNRIKEKEKRERENAEKGGQS